MEKFRKIGQWLWLNKERMVFVVMVIILCYRVYRVVTPEDLDDVGSRFSSVTQGPMEVPSPEVAAPVLPPPPPTAPLTRGNMFWYHSNPDQGGDEGEGAVNIELVGIQMTSSGPLARLRTKGGRPRPYRVGEEFENFRIVDIDVEARIVRVYDESTGQTIELKEVPRR